MNRRDLLKGFVAATATVAIGLRMASKMPMAELKDAIDTWRWELATDNYLYGLDLARPWDVIVQRRVAGDDWEDMDPEDLMAMAEDGIVVEHQEIEVRDADVKLVSHAEYPKWREPDTHIETYDEYHLDPECEEMEAAAVIAMSQGMAALHCQGRGPMVNTGFAYDGIDVCRVPRIHKTREALFRHG